MACLSSYSVAHQREYVAGTAAWGQQLALALGTIVILSAAQARHRRRFGRAQVDSGASPLEGMLRAESRVRRFR